ncbi:GNAT family N-acetyltransferase [Paenibacillus sp. SN-8-1]|uniref:GNAT family N-acetyltransferase n=1 Tax=Paenibacillus sp. SN-8-1 TaxID=3435409 RepID=UPI003D9AA4C3
MSYPIGMLTLPDQQLEIHLADQEDTNLICQMLIEAAEWMISQGINQWNPEQFTRDEILSYFEYREIYLIYANTEPAAMFTLQQSDPDYWGMRNSKGYNYLHRLTVRRNFSNAGLGAYIVEWAAERTRESGRKGLRLDCLAQNLKLNSFYQRLGFRYMGTALKNGREYNLYEQWELPEGSQDHDPVDFVYFNEKDFHLLQSWSASEAFQLQWAGGRWSYPLTEEDMRAYIEDANFPWKSDRLIFKVIHRLSREIIGHISLTQIDRKNRSARISRVILGDPTFRGRGIGKAMIVEMLRIGFQALNLHRITLGVFDFNRPAIQVYLSTGFKKEGLMREKTLYRNEYWSMIEMSMLRNEWEELYGEDR